MPTPEHAEQDLAEDLAEDLAARVRRLEDLHAIGQLRAHYCQALDDGRWDDLVDLFTPDGAFVGLSTARGHDELRTFFADLQDGPLSAWWHFSSNETIDLVGTPAHAATDGPWQRWSAETTAGGASPSVA